MLREGSPWSSGKDIGLIPQGLSPPVSICSNPARTDLNENVCQFTCGKSVVSSQMHCIIYVSWFSFPSIKTERHEIAEKLLSKTKNA
jgi:hypothetical protein